MFLAILALGLGGPALAASGGIHAVQGFAVRQTHASGFHGQNREAHPQVLAGHDRHGGFAGWGGPYSTLWSGTFISGTPEQGQGPDYGPLPYYGPYGGPPPYYAYGMPDMPQPCVKPLLIHVAPPQHHTKLPRVVYGTPFTCS
ncbi:MAG TPA: hypothetical protein VKV77_04230 [Methylovirgula sp.]|nr:hypothetical protein [Methylovirgula sp.]